MSDYNFKSGHRMVTLDPFNGPWCRTDSPMGMFIEAFCFLDWVQRDCPPPMVVTEVDTERGVITFSMSADDED